MKQKTKQELIDQNYFGRRLGERYASVEGGQSRLFDSLCHGGGGKPSLRWRGTFFVGPGLHGQSHDPRTDQEPL